MSWSRLCLLLYAACGFSPSGTAGVGDDGGPGGDGDASNVTVVDAALPDASPPDAYTCRDFLPFAPSNFDPCELSPPNPPLILDVLGVYGIDTDMSVLTGPGNTEQDLVSDIIIQPDAPELRVISTSAFRLGRESELHVFGSRALALVAGRDFSVAGKIDVGANGAINGPGGDGPNGDNTAACALGRGQAGVEQTRGTDSAGSGGGGGGFSAAGGDGAEVDLVVGAVATPGGQANGSPDLVPLRGGCAGGPGGLSGVNGGTGGGGGGALQLVAGGAMTVEATAVVFARGGSGGPVQAAFGGGGGAGSGGGLLLEGTTVDVNGALTANGGSGGEGARSEPTSAPGENGLEAQATPAPGGAGRMTPGGDGGDGGARTVEAGETGALGTSTPSLLAGGGGGGGSAGRIHLRSMAGPPNVGGSAVVSPAQQ